MHNGVNPYVVIDLANFSKAIGMAIWKRMAWSCNVFAQGYGSSKSTTKLIFYFIKVDNIGFDSYKS
jgi:hypothetical protein